MYSYVMNAVIKLLLSQENKINWLKVRVGGLEGGGGEEAP